jgi:hypothetical protein
MNSVVADLMRGNLLDVFNESDPERRGVAIARSRGARRTGCGAPC